MRCNEKLVLPQVFEKQEEPVTALKENTFDNTRFAVANFSLAKTETPRKKKAAPAVFLNPEEATE